jgi:hypothetical protein
MDELLVFEVVGEGCDKRISRREGKFHLGLADDGVTCFTVFEACVRKNDGVKVVPLCGIGMSAILCLSAADNLCCFRETAILN